MSRTCFLEETLLQGREPTMLGMIVVQQAQHEQTAQGLGTHHGKHRRLEAGSQPELGLSKAFWKTYKWKAMQGKAKYADRSFLDVVCVIQLGILVYVSKQAVQSWECQRPSGLAVKSQ